MNEMVASEALENASKRLDYAYQCARVHRSIRIIRSGWGADASGDGGDRGYLSFGVYGVDTHRQVWWPVQVQVQVRFTSLHNDALVESRTRDDTEWDQARPHVHDGAQLSPVVEVTCRRRDGRRETDRGSETPHAHHAARSRSSDTIKQRREREMS